MIAEFNLVSIMIRTAIVSLLSLTCATLFAQPEPQKSPAIGNPAQPPTAKEADKVLNAPVPPTTEGATTPAPAMEKNPPALDPANMDTSVKPSDDFYTYANGAWLKNNPIPPEFSRWGSFNMLAEKNNADLKVVCEKAMNESAEASTSPDVKKVGDYYATGIDEAKVDAAAATPLADELKRIDAIKDRNDVLKEIAHFHTMGATALFGFTSGQDDKNSTREIAQAFQDGLGLPDRDYYTKTDEKSAKIREEYVAHVTKMLTLLGVDAKDAGDQANKIMAMETELAKGSRTRVELRDPQKNYNKMKEADLQKLTPEFKWADYFKDINLANPGDINVGQPDFFKTAGKVFASTPIEDWKSYFRWHLAHEAAPELSSAFVNENFNFYAKTLTGAEQLKPRWKRVVASTDGALGEALGKLYVADYFPPESKARMLELVKNVQASMGDAIKNCSWMDAKTKAEALKKLAAMNIKIGYPNRWRDYSALKIDRDSYAQNALRASEFEVNREMAKIGKPVDRSEWGMTPPTVNAYYNPNMNEIVFPAGILQPPFFNAQADDAVNYGGIGAVIAHEITHGFDDQGRQYDAEGNLKDWWSKESADKYNARAAKIVAQYSSYEPLPGMHINGELTQGENIADDGGVKIAFAALEKVLAKNPEEANKKIDGFTPEQRFFLGWAQVWRGNQREADLRQRLVVDPHSPTKYRCNGAVSNSPDFQKAFNIPDGSPMVNPPDKRVSIW